MSVRLGWVVGVGFVAGACGGEAFDDTSGVAGNAATDWTDVAPLGDMNADESATRSDGTTGTDGTTPGADGTDGDALAGGAEQAAYAEANPETDASGQVPGGSAPASGVFSDQEADTDTLINAEETDEDESEESEDSDAADPDNTEEPCRGSDCYPVCAEGEQAIADLNGACLKVCTDAEGLIELGSDEAVAEFAKEACEVIDGSLRLTGTLSSVAGLESLRLITGSLLVEQTEVLESLTGLDGLELLGSHLVLSRNLALATLTGLESLTAIPDGIVAGVNSALRDFVALSNVEFGATKFTFSSNEALLSLDGLESATELENLVLADNTALISTKALSNVQSMGTVTWTGNLSLPDVELPALRSVEYLTVAMNDSLGSFIANALQSADQVQITTNALLETVELDALQTANFLMITDHPALDDIGTFPNLTSVNNLYITDNLALAQCSVDTVAEKVGGCKDCSGNDAFAACE